MKSSNFPDSESDINSLKVFCAPGLTLNVMGDIKSVNGVEKVWGLQGYATAVNNPDTTISFIFCKDMYPIRGFSSMYEANQISGVYFAGLNKNEGYIDDFGCWQTYGAGQITLRKSLIQ